MPSNPIGNIQVFESPSFCGFVKSLEISEQFQNFLKEIESAWKAFKIFQTLQNFTHLKALWEYQWFRKIFQSLPWACVGS